MPSVSHARIVTRITADHNGHMVNPASHSPWFHRKARTCLGALAVQSGLMRSVDEVLGMQGELMSAEYRALASVLIMIGRKGIWPIDPAPTLASAAQCLELSAPESPTRSDRKLTLQEHAAFAKAQESIDQEIEILRRRGGVLPLTRPLKTPSAWRPFWSGDSTGAPWHLPMVNEWLSSFRPWQNYTHHIRQVLEKKPQQFAHEIRGAAALVIMLGREKLWPTNDLDDVVYLASAKLGTVRNVIFSMSNKNKDLLNDERFRLLVRSIDEELRILATRRSRVKQAAPEEAPVSWAGFWN